MSANAIPIDSLAAEMLRAIRSDAAHFPPEIQSRGRQYHSQGRVGSLDVQPTRVGANVRGSRSYRTVWEWDGFHADPRCTCPASPVCKHAYALAQAIHSAHRDALFGNGHGPGGPRPSDPAQASASAARLRDSREHESAALADDLAQWARHHAKAPAHTLRAAFALDLDETGRPLLAMEVRVTTPRTSDAPRTASQVMQLASDVQRNPLLLAPPHTRLLRVLAATVGQEELRGGGTRFAVRASAINRLLDSFSGSRLISWAEGTTGRGGAEPGEPLRLGESTLDIVPVCSGEGADMRITLAARWPDGRQRPLDELLHVPSDDELHPSLVLEGGAFWRVAEEPPPHLMRRLAATGSLPVPEVGRSRFLELLASSFDSVADALAPHMRIHPTRPLVTLELGADDWLQLRLFAHTGEDGWRPGAEAPQVVAFELGAEGQWLRLGAGGEEVSGTGLEPIGETAGVADDPGEVAGGAAGAEPPAESAEEVLVEVPDPEPIVPVQEWLATLPISGRARPDAATRAAHADRGAWMRLGARNLEAFADAWERRPRGVVFLGNPRMQDLLGGRRSIRPSVTVRPSGVDWFTVSAEWRAEGLALTDADLVKLRSARTRFVKLSSGWVRRDVVRSYDEAAEVLADLGIETGAGEQRVTLAQLAQARPESLAALEAFGLEPDTVREVERLQQRVRGFQGLPRVEVPARLTATLRPYQRDGLDFLAFVTGLGMGAVLADDMGLGKTVQALAWIEWLRERDPVGGPVLVVCPASVVHNWQREAAAFTPHLRVLALTSGEERHALRREVPNHDLVVTNYALLRRDLEHWRSIPLRGAILDEAQFIKNPNAAVSRAVLELRTTNRLALTGTPIENRALDLWSIMNFVNPGYLGRRAAFVARYDRPDAPAHARRLLAARLRPVMVRRLKEEVAPDLPDRIEERRESDLTPGQRKLYLAELMRGRETLERLKRSPDGVMANKIEILATLTRLRQACCHPALVGGRESLGSGKFDTLFEILEPLMAEGRKVLVFSQFVECLKLLAAEMKRRKIVHHVLTGATTRREEVVAAFETDPSPCVFLISLKAGGTGLNLTAATYVVLFDPWWNPAVEAQAIDRAHRIGQTRTVIAYRMLAAGTIEEKIWELQQRKAALVNDVLGEDGFARTLTPKDLDYLLG